MPTPILDDELALGFTAGPRFNTSIIQLAGGREARNANWTYAPRFFAFAKPNCSIATAQAMQAFFYDRRGMAEPFWMKDWADYTLTAENIGTGTGAATTFQLKKTYGTSNPYTRYIYAAATADITVTVNGSPATVSSITDGLVTLSSAPGNGTAVAATGTFYCYVRFGSDDINITVDGPSDNQYARIDGLSAVEIIP